MQKILQILLLLSLPITIWGCQTTNTSLSHFQCKVSMQNCNNQPTFQNCFQKYCARSEQVYESGRMKTQCAEFAEHIYNQQECLTKCCGEAGIGKNAMDKKMLDICVQENYKLSNLIGIIAGSVFGGVAFVAIIVGVIYWKRRQKIEQVGEQTVNTLAQN